MNIIGGTTIIMEDSRTDQGVSERARSAVLLFTESIVASNWAF